MSNIDFSVGTRGMSLVCGGSPFLYKPAVITGNFNINHIRKLLMKGSSYRKHNNINCKSLLLDAIRKYKLKWANTQSQSCHSLQEGNLCTAKFSQGSRWY